MKSVLRPLSSLLFMIALLGLGSARAGASSISLGGRIAISPTTFALPVVITGARQVSSWQFDLTYDPTDVQVNTACDPFGGDIYCSLLTGPVTEGDFFATIYTALSIDPRTENYAGLRPVPLAQFGSKPVQALLG